MYELRTFVKGARGRYKRLRTLTIQLEDPYAMAVEVWRLTHGTSAYLVEVVDLSAARGKLVPLVTYEQLLQRAKKPVRVQQVRTRDQNAG